MQQTFYHTRLGFVISKILAAHRKGHSHGVLFTIRAENLIICSDSVSGESL